MAVSVTMHSSDTLQVVMLDLKGYVNVVRIEIVDNAEEITAETRVSGYIIKLEEQREISAADISGDGVISTIGRSS